MDTRITVFHTLFLICLAGSGICLITAAVLFVRLRIGKVIRFLLGRKRFLCVLAFAVAMFARTGTVQAEEPFVEVEYLGEFRLEETNGSLLFRDTAVAVLHLTESFSQANREEQEIVDMPVIRMFCDRGQDWEESLVDAVWTPKDEGFCAELKFPKVEGEETSYGFIVEYLEETIFDSPRIVVDDCAPILYSCQVEGQIAGKAAGLPVYENREGADVKLTAAIEEEEDCWKPEKFTLDIVNRENGQRVNAIKGDALTWKDEGKLHRVEYEFDGEAGEETSYQVFLSYEDQAGNGLRPGPELGGGTMTEERPGTYAGNAFILDHKAPEIRVDYNEDSGLVKDGTVSYFNDKIAIRVLVTDRYGTLEEMETRPFVFQVEKDEEEAVVTGLCWETGPKEGTFVGTYEICGDSAAAVTDGDYRILAEYRDGAGNGVSYKSHRLVLDTVAPTVNWQYATRPERIQGERSFFREESGLEIEIRDKNARLQELKESLLKLEALDGYGQQVSLEGTKLRENLEGLSSSVIEREVLKVQIPLDAEANYKIPIFYRDLAGNEAETMVALATVDKTAPDFQWEAKIEETGLVDAVKYKDLNFWFAGQKMTIEVRGQDGISGLWRLSLEVTDEEGDAKYFSKEMEGDAEGRLWVVIPLAGEDFKGTVKVKAEDCSDNFSEELRGSVVESKEKHAASSKAVIHAVTEPTRIVNGVEYYGSDVRLELMLEDTYSGIGAYGFQAGNSREIHKDLVKEADGAQEITYTVKQELTLDARSNNQNDVRVYAELTDHAGHRTFVEKRYHIDVTAPVIQVVYDRENPAGERYYNSARTATVTIRERNFDPGDVEFRITNTEGVMPRIGEWVRSGSGDETLHTCQVIFGDDGDYTFSVAFQDLAGNAASYERVDAFTIDRTSPVVTVTYDNLQCKNGYYYRKPRVATIDILEHNFDPGLVEVLAVSPEAAKQSSWTRSGDHHYMQVTFETDGPHTLAVIGMDLAENELPSYGPDSFVIDQSAPELQILDVADQSANKGVVQPRIRFYDENLVQAETRVILKGVQNGMQDISCQKSREGKFMEWILEDFPYEQTADDLYTLEASVSDMAGNQSLEIIHFSVNRFGSVYEFDEATAALVGEQGAYYTRLGPELVVTETNVDTLKFMEVTCNRNGKLGSLKRGTDYTVTEQVSDGGWKQYQYTIKAHNFEEEGIYAITLYSEDRAQNVSDNNSKERRIEFAVDRTPPSIVVSGVEHQEQYRENSRQVLLDIEDNLRLREVKVEMGDRTEYYDGATLGKWNGRITLQVKGQDRWQELRVTARDFAGNEKETETIRFLVTRNLWIQFLENKALVYGVCSMSGLGIMAVFCLMRRKEKHREDIKI